MVNWIEDIIKNTCKYCGEKLCSKCKKCLQPDCPNTEHCTGHEEPK